VPTKAKPIPQGFRSVTPYLTVNDAAGAIDFTNVRSVRRK
jgi:hypothetical protein